MRGLGWVGRVRVREKERHGIRGGWKVVRVSGGGGGVLVMACR